MTLLLNIIGIIFMFGVPISFVYGVYAWEKADDARMKKRRKQRSAAMARVEERFLSGGIDEKTYEQLHYNAERLP